MVRGREECDMCNSASSLRSEPAWYVCCTLHTVAFPPEEYAALALFAIR